MADVVIITGGTKGLGRASVQKWLAEGWSVATCARDEVDIAKLEAEVNTPNLLSQVVDIADEVAVRGFVKRILERWKKVDVLINNASILGPRETIENYSEETWRKVMDVNVNGTFYFVKKVLPSMLEQKQGVIVNVSSGAGVKGSKRWGAYAASKFAVEGLSQVLRSEVIDSGVRVYAFDPGAMQTEMRASAYPSEDPKQHPTPETIANILFDIATVYEPQLGRLTVKEYL